MGKVSIIGAGNVGGTVAAAVAHFNIASDVVLIDIKEGIAEGKAIDMMQSAQHYQFNSRVKGYTNDYSAVAESDVIVITSGIPRKPGMTREELIGVNAGIVKSVMDNCMKYAPEAYFIIVSNPMDTMTYLAVKDSKLPKNRVFGMGGALDSSRFVYYLREELGCAASDINAMVIGGHGDTTMIPLISKATYKAQPVCELLSKEKQEEIVKATMVGGATLTKYLGTSAWYAPGASVAAMVKSILLDEKKVFPTCTYLESEYGQNDICIGVPAVIGKGGVEKIIDINLNEEEKALFAASAEAVNKTNNVLREMKLV